MALQEIALTKIGVIIGIIVVVRIILALVCGNLNESKGYSSSTGCCYGLFFGLVGLLVVALRQDNYSLQIARETYLSTHTVSSESSYRKEVEEDSDKLSKEQANSIYNNVEYDSIEYHD